jgi:hypothetical protein
MSTRGVDPVKPIPADQGTRERGPAGPAAPPDPAHPSQRLVTEIARLRVRASGRDRVLLRLGAVLMAAGPVLAVVGYIQSSQTSSPLHQNDATIVAVAGLTVSVVGVGLFLRYSFGEFLRFWMARLVAEQARQAGPGEGPNPNGAPAPDGGTRTAPAARPDRRPPPGRYPPPDPRPQERP